MSKVTPASGARRGANATATGAAAR
jgi:hypothetical protein